MFEANLGALPNSEEGVPYRDVKKSARKSKIMEMIELFWALSILAGSIFSGHAGSRPHVVACYLATTWSNSKLCHGPGCSKMRLDLSFGLDFLLAELRPPLVDEHDWYSQAHGLQEESRFITNRSNPRLFTPLPSVLMSSFSFHFVRACTPILSLSILVLAFK